MSDAAEMTAETILDLNREHDCDLSGYDQVRIKIGRQVFRIRPRDGFVEFSSDGPLVVKVVASNWLEMRQEW